MRSSGSFGGGKAYIEGIDIHGRTPLHKTAGKGQTDIIKVLLEANADMKAVDDVGRTPLHHAVLSGNAEAVRLFLVARADIEAADWHGSTPLHLAAITGAEEIVQLLVKAKANIEAFDKDGMTPVYKAVELRQTSKDMNYRLLCIMVALSQIRTAKLLLSAESELIPEKNTRFIHKAVREGNEEIVKKLLQAKVSCDLLDESSRTPLHIAALRGHVGIVSMLIETKANTELLDEFKRTPLHMAILGRQEDAAIVLIEKGANIHALDSEGNSPLFMALNERCFKIAQVLLNARALVKSKDRDTLLSAAIRSGNIIFVNAALHNQAQIKRASVYAALVHMISGKEHKESCCECTQILRTLVAKGLDMREIRSDIIMAIKGKSRLTAFDCLCVFLALGEGFSKNGFNSK